MAGAGWATNPVDVPFGSVVEDPLAVVELPATVVEVPVVLAFFELPLVPVYIARPITTKTTTPRMTPRRIRLRRFCACCSSAMRAARPARWRARFCDG
jgi:hypothetical protein